MSDAFGVKPQEIGIMRDQHATGGSIIGPCKTSFSRRRHVNPSSAQARGDCGRNVFVQMEADRQCSGAGVHYARCEAVASAEGFSSRARFTNSCSARISSRISAG